MRFAELERTTKETAIHMRLELDGEGKHDISTGIGFFDHMLTHVARHGFFDLSLQAKGDTEVDCHHTIEDVGIVFGKCLSQALGERKQIRRYGSAIVPMDETLVLCAMDISGRAYLNFDCQFTTDHSGGMDTEMVEEFFRAVCTNCAMNLHVKVLAGKNNHHMAEGLFKAFGRALDQATGIDERIHGVLSTKGMLEA